MWNVESHLVIYGQKVFKIKKSYSEIQKTLEVQELFRSPKDTLEVQES